VDELKPKRRPFQFSLRKALLWTAVWSVYLGIVEWVGMPLTIAMGLTVCLLIHLVLRITMGFQRGFRFWVRITCGILVVLSVLLLLGTALMLGSPTDGSSFAVIMMYLALFVALCLLGGFLCVCVVVSAVDWLDNVMATRPPQEA
jgi:hypothetical protein